MSARIAELENEVSRLRAGASVLAMRIEQLEGYLASFADPEWPKPGKSEARLEAKRLFEERLCPNFCRRRKEGP